MKSHSAVTRLLLGILCLMLMPVALGADRVRVIIDGPERSVNAQIVRDISTYVAKPAGLEFDVRHSVGPPDTLMRLGEGNGQQFATLQADVAEAFRAAAIRGNIEAGQFLAPLRVISALHEEDIYFLVRSDSPLTFVHEIENARINLGPSSGSAALTTAILYRLMFNAPIPEQRSTFHSHQDALVKLTEQTVDVVVIVSPNPARRLVDMKPEARRFVKLLKFDPNHASASKILKVYSVKTIPATNYPNLLGEELQTLAVRIYLVSHGRNDTLQARLADSWCKNLPQLRDSGHPALRGLELTLPPLVSGWQYSRPFERELIACKDGSRPPAEPCTQEDRALGLCR